jgi:hypothetical protein
MKCASEHRRVETVGWVERYLNDICAACLPAVFFSGTIFVRVFAPVPSGFRGETQPMISRNLKILRILLKPLVE